MHDLSRRACHGFGEKKRNDTQDAARLRRTWNRRDGIAPPVPKFFGASEAGQVVAFADFILAGRATGLPLFWSIQS